MTTPLGSQNTTAFIASVKELSRCFSLEYLTMQHLLEKINEVFRLLTDYADCILAAQQPLENLLQQLRWRFSIAPLSENRELRQVIWRVYKEVELACKHPYLTILCPEGEFQRPTASFRYCLPLYFKEGALYEEPNSPDRAAFSICLEFPVAFWEKLSCLSSPESLVLSSSLCAYLEDTRFSKALIEDLFRELIAQKCPSFQMFIDLLHSPFRRYLHIQSCLVIADQARFFNLPKLLSAYRDEIWQMLSKKEEKWPFKELLSLLPYHLFQQDTPLNLLLTQQLVSHLRESPACSQQIVQEMPQPRHVAIQGSKLVISDSLLHLRGIQPHALSFHNCFFNESEFFMLNSFSWVQSCSFYNSIITPESLSYLPPIKILFVENVPLSRQFGQTVPPTVHTLSLHKTHVNLAQHTFSTHCTTLTFLSLRDCRCPMGTFNGKLLDFKVLTTLFLDGLLIKNSLKKYLPASLQTLSVVGCKLLTAGFVYRLDDYLPKLKLIDVTNTLIERKDISVEFPINVVGTGWYFVSNKLI